MFQNSKLNWLMLLIAVCTAIAVPGSVAFLPDGVEETVRGLAAFVNLVAGIMGFRMNPDTINKPVDKSE